MRSWMFDTNSAVHIQYQIHYGINLKEVQWVGPGNTT